MRKEYIAYHFTAKPSQPATEILIAELGELGFESFYETAEGVSAYIQKEGWDEALLKTAAVLSNPNFAISYQRENIPFENWNVVWEQQFDPITVGDRCYVRAPFHASKSVPYEIVIMPKMSFGTGHHETTYMMLELLLEMPVEGKKILDMGCGTGVLAILAAMMGAEETLAVDIDPICCENTVENAERNNQGHIEVMEGNIEVVSTRKFDLILANINRNTLLDHIPLYAALLNQEGSLLLSGFYTEDVPLIKKACSEVGLVFQKQKENNDWVAMVFNIPLKDPH